MAIGKASDFKIYHDQINGGFVETIAQNINAFNAAANGAIRLETDFSRGDYTYESFFQKVSTVSRRDTTSVSTVSDTALTQDEFISVKLNRKVGPLAQTLDALKKIQARLPGENGEEAVSFLLGNMIGDDTTAEWLNEGLNAAVAAFLQNSDIATSSLNAPLQSQDLVTALSTFGDAAGRIRLWVMHSSAYYSLVSNQISANVTNISDFNIRSGLPVTLGRPVLVTDSDQLKVTGSPTGDDDYYTLGLTDSGIRIMQSELPTFHDEIVSGLENLVVRLQGEFAFNVSLKGYKWNVGAGGANPTSAAVGTGTNWPQAATDDKDTAGVILTTKGMNAV